MVANRLSFILFLMFCQLTATASFAENGVGVVFHGGIDGFQIWEPDNAGGATFGGEVQASQELLLTPDLRVTPDGGFLAAQASGAGAIIFDSLGIPTFLLDPVKRYRNVSSVAVAGYLAGGQPARIAIADAFASVVQIRDINTEQVIWFQNMAIVAGFADIVEVVVLPDNRVAVASNYEPVGISLIDIFDFQTGAIIRTQYASFEHAEAPDDVIVATGLEGGIRSLFASAGGQQFIVAKPFGVVGLNLDGTTDWVLNLADYPAVGGEVSDAKILKSGLVVFATFEPGAWVEPSPDHRVYWYDPEASQIVAMTPPLDRAPAGIELEGGHGATGTLGYVAGVGDLGGVVDQLKATRFLVGGSTFDRGSLLRPEANIANTGTLTVELTRVRIEAIRGECGAPVGDAIVLAGLSGALGLFPSAAIRVDGEVPVDDGFEAGIWCARLWVTDTEGVETSLDELVFEVLDASDNTNVDETELEFEDLRDADIDMGAVDLGSSTPPSDDGCGCGMTRGLPGSSVFLLLFFFWFRKRRGLALLTALLIGVFLSGCDDQRPTPPAVFDPSAAALDLGFIDGGITDRPVPSLCGPGARRCVAENNPIYEECRPTGKGWKRESCNPGQICQGGRCAPFSCVPGRKLCVGSEVHATCDDSGLGVVDAATCSDATVCRAGSCFDLCAAAEASSSYIGCNYTAQRLFNYFEAFAQSQDEAPPWALVVANPDPLLPLKAEVFSLGSPAKLLSKVVINPGVSNRFSQVTTVRSEVLIPFADSAPITESEPAFVPPLSAAVFLMSNEQSTFKVRTTRPAVVSQYSPYCCNFTATNDASLLLPDYALGRRYRVVGYPVMGEIGEGIKPYVTIVALDQDAVVRVDGAVAVGVSNEDVRGRDLRIAAGEFITLETVTGSVDVDLTGIEVTSNVPVSVFTGHPCTFVPQDKWACDHLEEQLLPAETLGRRYVLVPTRRRAEFITAETTEATYWRIVADQDARVTLNPPLSELNPLPPSNDSTQDCASKLQAGEIVLREGEFCEFGTRLPTSLESTGELIVAGIISGHQSTGVRAYGTQAGDPSMFILPPVEQFRRDYSFVSAPTFKKSYVSIAAKSAGLMALDGRSLDESARLERRVVSLGGAEWEVFTVALEPGVHRLEADAPFGIVVYAYDDYVSYAFTGGLDLVPKSSQ